MSLVGSLQSMLFFAGFGSGRRNARSFTRECSDQEDFRTATQETYFSFHRNPTRLSWNVKYELRMLAENSLLFQKEYINYFLVQRCLNSTKIKRSS